MYKAFSSSASLDEDESIEPRSLDNRWYSSISRSVCLISSTSNALKERSKSSSHLTINICVSEKSYSRNPALSFNDRYLFWVSANLWSRLCNSKFNSAISLSLLLTFIQKTRLRWCFDASTKKKIYIYKNYGKTVWIKLTNFKQINLKII